MPVYGAVPAVTVIPENSDMDVSALETAVMLESVEVAAEVSAASPTTIVYVMPMELPLDSNLLCEVKSVHSKFTSSGVQSRSLAIPQILD